MTHALSKRMANSYNPPSLVAGLLAVVTVSCAEPAPPSTVSVVDSAGVQIVRSDRPLVADTIGVPENPLTVIRSDFGAPDFFFYRVTSAAVLSNGNLIVGNSGTSEVYRFSDAQEFLGVSGRAGDGPGEFHSVTSVHSCQAGAFAVVSPLRINVFDGAGEHMRTVPVTGTLADARARVVGVSPDCSSALLSAASGIAPKAGDGLVEIPQTLYWATFDGRERDTVAVVSTGTAQAWEVGGSWGWARVPFGPRTAFTTLGWNAVVGLARRPEVEVIDPRGRIESIIGWAPAANPLSGAEWDRFAESYDAFLREHPEERSFVPRFDLYEKPSTRPAYSRLVVDTTNRIWVQAYGAYGPFKVDSSRSWTVINTDGRLLAHVQMPDGLTVLAITGTTVIGVVRDEFDAEHISIHSLPEHLQG